MRLNQIIRLSWNRYCQCNLMNHLIKFSKIYYQNLLLTSLLHQKSYSITKTCSSISLPSTMKDQSPISTTFTADPELMIIDTSQSHHTYRITKIKVLLFVFQLIQAKDSTIVGHARDFVRLIDCIIIKLYIILFNSKNIEFLKVFLVYCI